MEMHNLIWLGLGILAAEGARREIVSIREAQRRSEEKIDALLANMEGLRQYLYEIDPQFDDEREADADLAAGRSGAVLDSMDIYKHKSEAGKRMLNTPFS